MSRDLECEVRIDLLLCEDAWVEAEAVEFLHLLWFDEWPSAGADNDNVSETLHRLHRAIAGGRVQRHVVAGVGYYRPVEVRDWLITSGQWPAGLDLMPEREGEHESPERNAAPETTSRSEKVKNHHAAKREEVAWAVVSVMSRHQAECQTAGVWVGEKIARAILKHWEELYGDGEAPKLQQESYMKYICGALKAKPYRFPSVTSKKNH